MYTKQRQSSVVVPMLESVEKFRRAGDTTPHLKPLPGGLTSARGLSRAENLWRHYWQLEKQPLLVRLDVGRNELPARHHLDAVLGQCQLRALDTVWINNDNIPRIIPLPLDLLGIVRIEQSRNKKRWPRLPVWAATPLVRQTGGVYEAQCIGNAAVVRHLLSFMPTMAEIAVRWEVRPLPLSLEEARETIGRGRPMPGQARHFTPPYDWDWASCNTET